MAIQTDPSQKSEPSSNSDSRESIWTRSFDLSILDVWFGGAGLIAAAFLAIGLGEKGLDVTTKLALASLGLLVFGLYRRFAAR